MTRAPHSLAICTAVDDTPPPTPITSTSCPGPTLPCVTTMRQAVNAMFVNLARRSQTLVERQLQLLDSLESSETDPDQLASLFRLDHLATRMRRNDENLLVLAGADSTRRWSEWPMNFTA